MSSIRWQFGLQRYPDERWWVPLELFFSSTRPTNLDSTLNRKTFHKESYCRSIRFEATKEMAQLPERSDSTSNFLGRFGGRGRRLFLLLVILELLLLLLLGFHGRLLDRLRRGRLSLARGED